MFQLEEKPFEIFLNTMCWNLIIGFLVPVGLCTLEWMKPDAFKKYRIIPGEPDIKLVENAVKKRTLSNLVVL